MAVNPTPAQLAQGMQQVRGLHYKFDDNTGLILPTFSAAEDSLASDIYGMIYRRAGGAGVEDGFYIVGKNASDAAAELQLATLTGAQTLSGKVLGDNIKRTVVDTGGAFAAPIALTAAYSGKIILLDDAAGLDFTLPALTAAEVGITYTFRLIVEPTSNSYRWTAQAADLLIGHIVIFDKDVAEGSTEALLQVMRPDVTDDLVCTITGSDDTQGSLVGGMVTFEALSATRWFVHGTLIGDGALATNFS